MLGSRESSSASASTCRDVRTQAPAAELSELAAAEPVLRGSCLPVLAEVKQVELLLPLPRREGGDAGGGEPFRAERLHVLDKRAPSAGERADRLLRDALELGHPVVGLRPEDAKPLRELVAELRFVEVAGGSRYVLRIASPSSASHSPSSARAMFATITCVCRCGSCARLVRWRKAVATKPWPGSRIFPPLPRRTTHASRSR
jgi:hypothetical protein